MQAAPQRTTDSLEAKFTGVLPDIFAHRDSLPDVHIVREFTMRTTDRRDQIAASLRSLVHAYSKALTHLEDTLAVICRELDLEGIETFYEPLVSRRDSIPEPADADRPVADRTLLSVRWRGKTCFLGNTLPFRLLDRLARRPNQYFSYEQLLDDVWEGPRSFSAIRSVVKVLRRKLVEAGMDDLANTIDGTVSGLSREPASGKTV